MTQIRSHTFAIIVALLVAAGLTAVGQAPTASPHARGSLVEDRAARKLLDAGDVRMAAEEPDKALEIWESIIERYPRSRHRFDAHIRLGDHLLESEQKFDKARGHFESAATEDNPDDQRRSEATLKLGICFFESRHYGKAFTVLRGLIEKFPASEYLNKAYFYIGLGHFRLGHYSRAIAALEKVGTALSIDDPRMASIEAGRRLYLKIEDFDLSILEPGEIVAVQCRSGSGDSETVSCIPLGRNIHLVIGSLPTALGVPIPENGSLEVLGGDTITVTYSDHHTSQNSIDQKRSAQATVVGTGIPKIMDGTFNSTIDGAVIGKRANLQIADADRDRSSQADSLSAKIEILRRKTDAEVEQETADLIATDGGQQPEEARLGGAVPRFKSIDSLDATFTETSPPTANGPAPVHTGIFRSRILIDKSPEVDPGDDKLQALPGDMIRISYIDELNLVGEPVERVAEATCILGDLGDVRVTRAEISDRELHLKTRLRTASALTQIGNHYKEFGLSERAGRKYHEALGVSSEIESEARVIGGPVLEETYVQLWRTYFAMEELGRALAMSRKLLSEFPNSAYVDEAMLQQAHVARKNGELARAIELYSTVVKLRESPLRGEAQFGVAECYEDMALAAPSARSQPIFDRAFSEYQKIYDEFPDSGRIGEAVSKMASFFYQKQDYARAIDVFEIVFDEHPDAAFLDVILFNYGRCLYRLERKIEARQKFDRLIADYPESQLAAEAKQISNALVKAGF